MQITFIQAILLSLVAFLTGGERFSETFYICRPLIVSTLAGLVVGNLSVGLATGAAVELAAVGIAPIGGASVPDWIIAAIMTVVIAHTTGVDINSAFGIGFTFGYLMQYVIILQRTAYSVFVPKCDEMAKKLNIKGMVRTQILGFAIIGALYAIITFLCVYVAQDVITTLVNSFPEKLMHGLSVAGGLMPAIGFGILLTVIYKPKYLPYLILGFVSATFISFNNILPTALIGLAMALMSYYSNKNKESEVNENDGI